MAKLQKKSIVNLDELRQILIRYWGHSKFRPLQTDIIQSVLKNKDTLALMPTGGGKSVTFQIPALSQEGICLVITPLISLMKDQVDQLISRKIKAVAVHSGMTRHEIDITLDNCIYGDFKFLYVSPERLATDVFRERVRNMNVNLIAVDEAHCISQWGYDFRPSYLEICSLREILPEVPVLALTATATPEVCDDIQERLSFPEKNLLKKSFDRENLTYVVRHTEDKIRELIDISRKLKGSGIIYARNRKKCREITQLLREAGVTSNFYHAGLKQTIRDTRQGDWIGSRFRLMVATNAFGMGIDKPDVRFVIHLDLPDTPEAYFQEAGRAGRDGKKSWAILLYSPSDKRLIQRRIEVNFPGIPKIREVYKALCNYLQVPLGSGKGQSYDFEVGEFLHRYRYNAMIAHSALNILSREGYITISEAFNNPSRVKFRARRDELYSFQVKNAEFDDFIKLLLRSYSGLFSQYVKIDETFLSKRSGLSSKRIYNYLKTLTARRVIYYIPRKEIPVITFIEERLDEKNLLISPERYHFRRERYEYRIGEMLRYASSETLCRNQFLLSYFGQLEVARCGRCDVCRSATRMDPKSDESRIIEKRIAELLTGNNQTLESLVSASGFESEMVLPVLERLVDLGKVVREKDLQLRWIQS